MTSFTPGIHDFARSILSSFRHGETHAILLTGADPLPKHAVAAFVAGKAGIRVCPVSERLLRMQRGQEMAVVTVESLSVGGGVVMLELDGLARFDVEGASRLVERMAAARASGSATIVVASVVDDDVDPDLAAAFDQVGHLDESGFVSHRGAAPAPGA